MEERRYKFWCFGKGDGVVGVGVRVKEKLCEVVEVSRMNDSDGTCVGF